jgi:hypothetical protein
MLIGRYVGSQMRPMIEAHVSIPSIKAGGFVQFLIDTGADTTTITPADGKRLRVDYAKLTREDHAMGYTGASVDFICDAVVTFAEGGLVEYQFQAELRLTKPEPGLPELFMLPSLLGRDILNRWQTTFDPVAETITANVISYDRRTENSG